MVQILTQEQLKQLRNGKEVLVVYNNTRCLLGVKMTDGIEIYPNKICPWSAFKNTTDNLIFDKTFDFILTVLKINVAVLIPQTES